MENKSLNDGTAEQRKTVRFSSTPEEYVFNANRTWQGSNGGSTAAPMTSDENLFRVPTALKKKDSRNTSLSKKVPLGELHHGGVELTFSPGTKATEDKFKSKIRKLREMQEKRTLARVSNYPKSTSSLGEVPSGEIHHGRVELTISPGTKATEDKFKKKIRKLQEMQEKRKHDRANKTLTPKIDLAGTEESFLKRNSIERRNLQSSQLAYSVPEPSFSDISCIRSSDATFSLKPSAVRNSANVVCSTPLRQIPQLLARTPLISGPSASDMATPVQMSHPATIANSTMKEMVIASSADYLLSKEDRAQNQMKAMSVWCNMILRSQYEYEELDMGTTKHEANKMLQDLLLKSKLPKSTSELDRKPFSYADFLRKQKRDCIREAASRFFKASEVPKRIRSLVKDRVFFVRADCNVHSDLTLQTTLLRLFLSFHPAWLHLGLETIFATEIKVGDDEGFAQVISRFIVKHLFSDSKIMKNKKFAYGGGKLITDAGREALHSHFLLYTSLFCYFVESAKAASIIKHNPGMFSKKSTFKSMEDVFSELSREVLSGSGTPMSRAFSKIGFKATIKQTFLDNCTYSVSTFGELTDGVVLGKIIELVTECSPGILMSRLREPRGDRLRKIGNVKICLQVASERGIDVQAIKPESIVSGNSDAILEVLWKLVGVYVCSREDLALRRSSLTLRKFYGEELPTIPEKATSEELVLQLCRQIGDQMGIKVESLNDLRDGMVFAGAWRMYNVNAPDIRLYPGDSLLLKVANAAESNLDVPWAYTIL
ncbi:hypothetical protein KIN20_015949 [Parelaphostrongylus tenuis]|uniref:Calponin-homology (CH) domain-containing protein n=1 Tax=Parelaphostrongylus tenuis TaxID=148309 RepID=A0AAD5MZ71_PARTN|nr:hypothetical protein KIN20_015949 [Parelaphostrongylus tenuis]